MRQRRLVLSILLVAILASAAGVGLWTVVAATATPAEAAGPCRCPQVYAPVTCDNGKTYPNQCMADCRHARNCVPSGDI